MSKFRYEAAINSIGYILEHNNAFDITREDFEFLCSNRLFTASDRGQVRRCIESVAYGAVDLLGTSRLDLPSEFIAAVIIKYVHPMNWMLACSMMEGSVLADNVIAGVEAPVSATELFSHLIVISSLESFEKMQFAMERRELRLNKDALTMSSPVEDFDHES